MKQIDISDMKAALGGRAGIAPTVTRLFLLFSVILLAEIAFEAAHIVYLQVATFHPLPFFDEWRTLILFSRVEQNADAWSLLFVPHAEHRPFLPRLIFLLDTKLAHGTGAFSLAAIDCMALGLVAIWSFLLVGHASRKQLAAPYVLILCIAALLFSGHHMSNFLRAFQVTMFMLYLFAVLSFAAFALASETAGSRRPQSMLFLSLSCFFAVCASFSMGGGVIVLAILFIMAWVRRRGLPAGAILIVAIVVVATTAVYLAAPGSIFGVLGRTDYKLGPGRAIELAGFYLAFLGGPWANIAPNGVTVAGAAPLLLSACAMVKYWRRNSLRPYELVAAGVIALTLGSAAVVALARLRFGIEAATESRYSTTVLMLYAALLVSFWPRVQLDAAAARPNQPSAVQIAALALLVLAILAHGIASHWKLPYDYSDFLSAKADAEVAYVANVQDPLPFANLAPQPPLELAWQARGYALRHKLSVFSTAAAQSVGRPLSDVFRVLEGGCTGHLDGVERVIAGPNGGFRLAGWAWDANDRSVPPAVLLVEDGIIRGIGRFTRPRPDVASAVPGTGNVKNGFVGYVPRGVTKVNAYVLGRDDATVCRIPGELALPLE